MTRPRRPIEVVGPEWTEAEAEQIAFALVSRLLDSDDALEDDAAELGREEDCG